MDKDYVRPVYISNEECFLTKEQEVKNQQLVESFVKDLEKIMELKDSGDREKFESGAVRDGQYGKGAFELVPNWVVWLVSRVYEAGARKYAPRNWEAGMPLSQYIRSAENHMAKLKCGLRDEPHACQVIWNMIGYVFTAGLIKLGVRPGSLNDMPDQIHCVPGKLADPLSPMENESLEKFFGPLGEGKVYKEIK